MVSKLLRILHDDARIIFGWMELTASSENWIISWTQNGGSQFCDIGPASLRILGGYTKQKNEHQLSRPGLSSHVSPIGPSIFGAQNAEAKGTLLGSENEFHPCYTECCAVASLIFAFTGEWNRPFPLRFMASYFQDVQKRTVNNHAYKRLTKVLFERTKEAQIVCVTFLKPKRRQPSEHVFNVFHDRCSTIFCPSPAQEAGLFHTRRTGHSSS